MIEFGKTLRTAREGKGITIGQLAEMTRMAPTSIQDLESENFTRIAAPIYGRGFVKLYCEAVGLDPKPLVTEFMEIYNGNREPDIRERPEGDSPAPASPDKTDSLPEPIADEPEPRERIIALEPAPAQAQAPTPLPSEPAVSEQTPDLFGQESVSDHMEEEPTLSRYAAPIRQARPAIDPHTYLRLGLLGIGAVTLLVLMFCGIRAVYRATTPAIAAPATEPVATTSASPATETKEKKADKPEKKKSSPVKSKTVRTPQKIPSLYID